MDRNRDARRAAMAAPNGLSRRRHRSSSLRDSPEDDGPVELQETSRLRDRKKDRDRDRDRDRERDRDRDRERDRLSRSKRRRGERLMHGSNREDGGDDSSEESVNDEEEDEDDDGGGGVSVNGGGGGSIRMLPPNPSSTTSISSSLNHRKSFSPVNNITSNNKHFRPHPALKVTNEMIGVSVPRKARSASTKRSHEWPSSCGVVGGDQLHRQASTSPVRPATSAMAAPSPSSPSSSHASAVRKKLKPSGPKLRPPKMSSSAKTTSSNQDDIEIEIAEVLYGMKGQPQGPTKEEIVVTDSIKFESREANKSTSDAKSRVSSPISNSPCALPQPPSAFTQNSSSSVTSMSAVAPKRKRPRPVKYDDESPSIFTVQNGATISTTSKVVTDQPAKVETSSPNLERNLGSAAENGGFSYDLANPHTVPASSEAQPEPVMPESKPASDSKPANDESESKNVQVSKEEPQSPKKESPALRLDDNRQDMTVTKANSTVSEIENQREEKFQIDLMAPPERDGEVDFISVDPKPTVIDAETEIKPMTREDDKVVKFGKEANVETEKSKAAVEEAEFKKPIVGSKERNIDLQLDLEKTDRDSGTASFSGNKLHHNVAKQQNTEKTVQSSSVPLPMSVAAWPGGLPPMGYMAPLQGVVSMDGSTVSSAAIQPPHLLFNQPRPKRCETHRYIARNIFYHQQMSRMNPFWPVAAGSGSLYGGKHCNPNVLPPELHGNIPGRGVNSAQDKGHGLAMFPSPSAKDKSSQAANLVEAAQRKQIVLQQALPPGTPSNILHGPAFIFPLNQQQAAAAASVRPASVKSPNAGAAALSSASNSAPMTAAATAAPAPAMSFNYPNMAGNEPQYLAIVQNNAYPFPMPAHVGAPPAYRGPHAQPMSYFNGSFYSSQMLHPSHLQQQQQQQPPPSQSQQSQQGHQNPSISSGSSSSQIHLQNQQQRPHPSGVNGGSGSLQGFPTSKNPSSQALQLQQQQQRQQQQNPHPPHQARQLEPEMGGEDSPSTADSRVSRANMNIYGQNFAMPMHPPNFALMTPPSSGSTSGATGASGTEKKQQQGAKAGVEASQAFAMSFAPVNGATAATGIDLTSLAQNHAILQSFPEVTRQGYHHFMAVQAAQHKKSYRVPEEGKTGGGDSPNVEEERKAMGGKASSTLGHSIAFSRTDLTDTSGSTIPSNNVIDSSARTLNLSSTPGRASSSVLPPAVSTVNAPTPQQQLHQQMQQQMRNHQQQQQQQQQQQMIQLQKQPFSAAVRSKTPATSNGSVYSDHLPSTSSMAAKFPNALSSSFPQNLVQSSSSPAQSPQWKNSARTTASQVPSSSLASSTSSSLKNLPQKHGRTQQNHTQISFAANTKSSTQSQGLQPASSNQSPSPPVMVGSPTPTTSSMSKSAGGSPRTTTSTSTGNKAGQASSLSSQQAKNSPLVPSQKSSPVGGRNVPSILGNTHITSSSTGTKSQLPQQHQQQLQQQQQHQHQQQQHQHQQQQQQLSKQSIQQAQFFFSNAYIQAQASHSNNATSTAPSSGYYHIPRRRPEQQQLPQGSSGSSSSGMLSLCPPVTHSNTSTTDPAKAAAAAAANNMKGSGLSSQTLMHHAQFAAAQSSGPHQLLPGGFPYVHAVPTVVQVKPAEQKKQPAGE